MTHPPCFDSKAEFDAWEEALSKCAFEPGHPPPTYCSDCLPDYKAKMLEQGRCIHPTVRFFKNGPQSYYGRRVHLGKKEPGQ